MFEAEKQHTPQSHAGDHTFFGGRARLIGLHANTDARGRLLPFEFPEMPFIPRRAFTVADVPAHTKRGGHGHHVGQQFLICLNGRLSVKLLFQGQEQNVVLEGLGSFGLLIGNKIWAEQTYEETGTILLVFSSHPYDLTSYMTTAADVAPQEFLHA